MLISTNYNTSIDTFLLYLFTQGIFFFNHLRRNIDHVYPVLVVGDHHNPIELIK